MLRWTPSEYTGGSESVNYTVFLAINGADYIPYLTGLVDSKTRIDDMVPGDHLSFKIQAYNWNMVSEMSDPCDINFLTEPSVPLDLTEVFSERSETTVTLTWSEPENFGGSENLLYTILKSENGEFVEYKTGLSETSFVKEGL